MNVHSRIMAPAVLGAAAIATTTVLLVLQIVLALPHSHPAASTRTAAIIAAILECATLISLSFVVVTSIRRSPGHRVTARRFGYGIGLCVVAAALTAATLACLSKDKTVGVDTTGYVVGTSIVFAMSFSLQALFLVSRFIVDRVQRDESSPTPSMLEIGRRSPMLPSRVKTIPYSRTSPPTESRTTSRTASIDSRYPPGSSGGFSAASTIYSKASYVVRSASSKTKLLASNRSSRSLRSQRSQRSARRAASIESCNYRERTSAADDSFDSWDTSGVDPQNRQLVIETTSPIGGGSRFLETIPASPTTSRSPSPGDPLDRFDLPRTARRSRSFSPATSTRSALPAPPKRCFTTQQTSASESHIHPLFRSDSPTPPPMASPGTIVIAAPQAGQIISDRQSIRSLSRMRSGSLPAVSSPLGTKGSFDSFVGMCSSPEDSDTNNNNKTFSATSNETMRTDETALGEVLEEPEVPERKITPPVPDYILDSGSQTSLHVYPARKTPSRDGPRGPGLDALDSW